MMDDTPSLVEVVLAVPLAFALLLGGFWILERYFQLSKGIHLRADRIRTREWGRAEELRRDGLPDDAVEEMTAAPIAVADLLDALAEHPFLRWSRRGV